MVVCHNLVWEIMLFVAIVGFMLLPISTFIGPPDISSWAAQHLHFLSQSGGMGLDLGMSPAEDVRDSEKYQKMYQPVEVNKVFILMTKDRKVRYTRRLTNDETKQTKHV